MAISLKHAFQSAKADGADTSLVRPSNWNAEHVLTQATNRLLGRTTATDGATEEISVGSGLTFSALTLSANVTSVAGRTGAVTIAVADVSGAAPLASPTFTGVPAAPTAAADTNTTQVATTAYVVGQAGSTTPAMDGTAAVGTSLKFARADHVHPTDTSRAPLASPTFTGVPAAPTAAADTNTTQLATTAYVVGQGYLKSSTASSTYAPLASPTFTGVPAAPTAAADTNTTQVATTAYVVGQGYLKSATAATTYAALASPTFTGTATLVNAYVSGNIGVGQNSPASKLDVSGGIAVNVVAVAASAIDCSAGTVFTKTATGALTWTFTNVPASRSFTAILELTNGGTGIQTWPASVKWPSGTAPTLTTAGVDVLAFFTDDGGTTWRGVQLMKDSK